MEQPGDLPPTLPNRGEPIGGWLILPALGLIVTPVMRIYYAVKDFQIISNDDPELFDSVWFYSVYGIETLLLVYGVVVAMLFFRRHRFLPVAIQAFTVTCVVGEGATQALDHLLLESDFDSKALIKVVISAAIWIPYFSFSKRVKATFVN